MLGKAKINEKVNNEVKKARLEVAGKD